MLFICILFVFIRIFFIGFFIVACVFSFFIICIKVSLFDSIVLEHGYNNAYSKDVNELKTITLNDINKENIDQLIYKKNMQNKLGF